jgi:hypothetical protein
VTGLPGSLESVRLALDNVDSELGRLLTDVSGPGGDQARAAAYRTRAQLWSDLATLSFDDVQAGDLLSRAARHAAAYDLELAQACHP